MTFSPSPDAFLIRGKTLTPESPRPLYIPEPANIPVLENQIDPIFNLTSTHLSSAPPQSALTAMDGQLLQSTTDETAPLSIPTLSGNETNFADATEPSLNDDASSFEQETQPSITQQAGEAQQQSESLNNFKEPSAQSDLLKADTPFDNLSSFPTTLQEHLGQPSTERTTTLDDIIAQTKGSEVPENLPPDPTNPAFPNETQSGDAVNYQVLLDNIISANATKTDAETAADAGVASPSDTTAPPLNSANVPPANVAASGLPPRPPPQEKPAIHPNYDVGEDIRAYHYPGGISNGSAQPSSAYAGAQTFPTAPGTTQGANGLPPPPSASFQTSSNPVDQQLHDISLQQHNGVDMAAAAAASAASKAAMARRQNAGGRDDNAPWGPDIQVLYDRFLEDETVYTAEGTWDKFPKDSRLFVGNLPTEVVTKRDIFHIFHRYGRLAQISIKNAYGFVQFMDETACRAALHAEQGKKIKDKNMHLEISKPPKNSRAATSGASGSGAGVSGATTADRQRGSHYRRSRSRSPERDRRPGSRSDRFGSNEFRDGRRRGRDDYRPGRSPSPRGDRNYRARDRSADRYGGRRDRSRSPPNRYRNRSPSPRRGFDDEDDGLPIPRRHPRDVPEVQIVLIDQLDRLFVDFIQGTLRGRGLTVGVLTIPPQTHMNAIVRRQVVEGVLAVIKLHHASQARTKIPVQIFDRSGGPGQVRFEEYEDLDANVAAELVVQSKQKQAKAAIAAQPQYGAVLQQLGANPNLAGQLLPNQGPGQPNLASLITQLDGPALQKLLGAIQANPSTPQSAQSLPLQSPTQNPGFAAMMAQPPSVSPGGAPAYGYPPQSGQPSAPPPQPLYGAYHAQVPPQGQQQQPSQYPYPQNPPQQQQVQDIMSQLARWRQ